MAILAGAVSEMSDLIGGEFGYWKFDDGSGSTAADSSGNANPVTLSNSPTFSSTTAPTIKFPNTHSLQFNGTNQFGICAKQMMPSIDDATIACWVNISSLAINRLVYAEYATSPTLSRFELAVTTAGALRLGGRRLNGDAFTIFATSADSLISIDTWYHVAGIYRNSGGHDVYINGHAVTLTRTGSGSFSAQSTIANVARNNPLAALYYAGLLDDLRVFRSDIGLAGVQTLAAGGPFAIFPRRRRSRSGGGVL
jgi:hypothetical protein